MIDRRVLPILSFAILLCILLTPTNTRAAAPGEVDKAKAYLYALQKNGTWEIATDGDMSPKGRHRGGLTALVTYALVASGENPQDPRLIKALDFLKTADIPSAYALGCRAQLWSLLPPGKETRRLAQADAERLIKQIKGAGDARGLFHYPETPPDSYDMSVSQYGVLGLWACENAGAEIRGAAWEEMDRAWRAHQLQDGGWSYHNNPGEMAENGASPSMTAAGIATLFITHDAVRAKDYLGCTGNKQDDNIARGLDWMTRNFNQVFTGGVRGPSVVHYTLYGIERVGVAAGYKYFGKTDWFAAGSDFLLKSQDGRIEPYALGADILLYAVDKKGLRNRNVTYTIRPNPAAPIERSLKLARLSYPGNWDPEPGGWRRMAALLRNQNKVDLQIMPVALGEGKLCEPPPSVPKLDPKELRTRATKRIPPDQIAAAVAAGETAKIESLVQAESQKIEQEMTTQAAASRGKNSAYAIAHLTGSSRNTFTPAQVKELSDFVNGGGTLLIDCTGGSTECAESLQPLLAVLPGGADALKTPLPADHPLFKELAGKELYRTYAKPRLGSTRSPRLRGGGGTPERPALLYSPEDLSTGLVGQEVDGVIGYTPDAATALVRQVLLRAGN